MKDNIANCGGLKIDPKALKQNSSGELTVIFPDITSVVGFASEPALVDESSLEAITAGTSTVITAVTTDSEEADSPTTAEFNALNDVVDATIAGTNAAIADIGTLIAKVDALITAFNALQTAMEASGLAEYNS